MKYDIVLSPQSKADIKGAFDYYENVSIGLGERFLVALDEIVLRIREFPTSGSMRIKNIRSRALSNFPYTVYYVCKTENITIVRVFNNYQRPFW